MRREECTEPDERERLYRVARRARKGLVSSTLKRVAANLAEAHPRPLPERMAEVGAGELDPELRALRILGARADQIGSIEGKPWAIRSPRRGALVAPKAAAGGEN